MTHLGLWLEGRRSWFVTRIIIDLIIDCGVVWFWRWICGECTRFLRGFGFVPGRGDFVGRMVWLLGLCDEIRLGGYVPLTGGRH